MKKAISLFCILMALVALIPLGVVTASSDFTVPAGFDVFTFTGSDVKIALKSYQKLYYDFDLSVFGTAGHSLALYFEDDGAVIFSEDVSIYAVDGTTFAQVPKDVKKGEVLTIADINDYNFTLGTTNDVLHFVQASNAGNYAGMVPDKDLSIIATPVASTQPAKPAEPESPSGADTGEIAPPKKVPTFVVSYVPKGLEDALYNGTWPLPAGQYYPELDNVGIPDGVEIYGLFDATYTAIPVPTSIMGYTEVESIDEVKDGTYCVATVGGTFQYVFLGKGRTVKPTSMTVIVNGVKKEFEAYNINDSTYFKLRDLAYVINGSEKQFDVGYDNDAKAVTIVTEKAYAEVGGEMDLSKVAVQTAKPTNTKIYFNGIELPVTAYLIHDNNFLKLREVMEAVDVNVGYDNDTRTITLDTSAGYVAP